METYQRGIQICINIVRSEKRPSNLVEAASTEIWGSLARHPQNKLKQV